MTIKVGIFGVDYENVHHISDVIQNILDETNGDVEFLVPEDNGEYDVHSHAVRWLKHRKAKYKRENLMKMNKTVDLALVFSDGEYEGLERLAADLAVKFKKETYYFPDTQEYSFNVV